MNKKIKIGLFVLIILGTITLCLTYESNDKIIKTKKRKQNNLAIMIKEDGATDYTKSNSKDIPKGDYVLNRDKSYCKNNGKIGNYDSTLGKVSFSFIGTDSCYLYFDYKEDTSLYGTIKKRAKTDTTYLALYTGEGADTYANPVYYYKGNVENNNVLFAGFCWKIVRTTETGGVKIVYNGVQKDEVEILPIEQSSYANVNNDATYPYKFDSTSKTWVSTNKTNSATGTLTFTVDTAGDYYLSYVMSSEASWDKAKFYKNGTALGDSNGYSGTQSGAIALTGLTTSDVIKVEYTKDSSGASGSDTVTFSIGKAVGDPVKSCNNTGTDSQIGTSAFNSSADSPAYVGYMHNTAYPYSSKAMYSSNIVFGNSFTYNNGTYTLTDTKTVATWDSGYNTINNNHYTCMTTGTTCSSIYYVYYTDSSWAYYITLTGGKSVSDALNEMLYADDVNKNDSTIKAYIDSWYEKNLASYEDRLEDTVFCNDRSISSLNGWNPNGGSTTSSLIFKSFGTSNQSLVCANETDRFSMNNAKAKLKHPIGLLSWPELRLAVYGSSHYYNNGQSVWFASPSHLLSRYGTVLISTISGSLSSNGVDNAYGVRPSISLKPNTEFTEGDGLFTNPFVIGDVVEKPSGKSFDTVFVANDTDIFDENGLRYEGEDPYNYICLDNKTSGGCSDSSLLFRIIGLFDEDTSSDGTSSSGTKKLLKVIDTNNYGGKDGKYWNSAGTNNWSTASLKTELNGTYLTTLLGTSNVNSKLNTAIVTSKWHLGGASPSNCQTITADGIYTEERNTSAIYSGNPASIYAKVGLMYPSDYGYATVGGTTNKSRCREKELYNWDNSSYSDCKNNDWLYKSQSSFVNNREWFLSPYSSVSNYAAGLFSSGFVYLDGGSGVGSSKAAVRPTFYLDSSILKIVGTGDGSSSNPYRIG